MAGPSAVADRFRAGLPGCGPGVAGVQVRGPVAAVRPRASGRDVSLPAAASWLQPAAARRFAADQAGDPAAGGRHRLLAGQRVDRRFHAGGMRPLAPCRPALGPGGLGELRLLRLAFPLVLGTAAVSDRHPGRSAGRWPTPNSTSAKCWPRCWTPSPSWQPPGRA
jgi:hypothetical protein